MPHRVRNVPSEASIECPKCGRSYKGRTLKGHIQKEHKLLCIYTCIFPKSDGEVCNFGCGKRISCINNHQSRRHGLNFDALSEHEYTGDNFFTLRFIALGEDKHTSECSAETKFFQAETQKGVNARQAEERAAARKRKSESAAPEKVAKRTKKEKTVKDSHATEPLPAAGSIPSGKDDLPGKAGEPNKENAVGVVVAVGGTQNDEGPKDGEVPEDEPEEDESDEFFYEQFNAHQDFSDSEDDDDDEVVCLTPKPQVKLEEALMFKAGCGRFSPDITQLCKAVRAEMQRAYPALKNDPKGWKRVIRKLQKAWHPDNNKAYTRKSTEVFKCIEQEREKLEG